MEFPACSNRQVAEQIGCTDKTVGAVRDEMESRAEIPHVAPHHRSNDLPADAAKSFPRCRLWRDPGAGNMMGGNPVKTIGRGLVCALCVLFSRAEPQAFRLNHALRRKVCVRLCVLLTPVFHPVSPGNIGFAGNAGNEKALVFTRAFSLLSGSGAWI